MPSNCCELATIRGRFCCDRAAEMTGGCHSRAGVIGGCRGGYSGVPFEARTRRAVSKPGPLLPLGYPRHGAFLPGSGVFLTLPPSSADRPPPACIRPTRSAAATPQTERTAASGNRPRCFPYRCALSVDTGTRPGSCDARPRFGPSRRFRRLIPCLATRVALNVGVFFCQDPQPRNARGYCLLLHGSMRLNFSSRFSARARFRWVGWSRRCPLGGQRGMGRTSMRGIAWDRWME